MTYRIPFNKPHTVGKELAYVSEAIANGKLSGDGPFTRRCHEFLQRRFATAQALLTTSGTAALEMAALLCDIEPGDEVILPSYTFVSTANAFVLRGAKPVFVDIRPDTLNIDERLIEQAISSRSRVIVPVHYAGVSCEMDVIQTIAQAHKLRVVEDAAQAIGSTYKGLALGSIGDFGCFSFHETKNVVCGEGGALLCRDRENGERAEIIREKGTNRAKFFRGQVDKYTWVDIGSSFLPSDMLAAFLLAQLEEIDSINLRRKKTWELYRDLLTPLAEQEVVQLPTMPAGCVSNHHMFYLLVEDLATRTALLGRLVAAGILATFHYVPLHTAPMGINLGYRAGMLPITESVSERLIRLPLYGEMTSEETRSVCDRILGFYSKSRH
jgi:dTDP-4-amino-4,6-dideoxygalactose transaminase